MTTTDSQGGHVDDELALLLGGELNRTQLPPVVAHLRGCSRCRAQLVEASAAHAALTAARRVLDPVSSDRLDELFAAPSVADDELPPLPAIRRSGHPASRTGRDRGVRRRDVLVGAVAAVCAAAIALGGVAATGNWPSRGSRSSTAVAAQQARLVPVVASSGTAPVPTAAGVVRMSGSGQVVMTIHITGLPPAAAGHFYYAWLLDPATQKMLPVGVVDPTGSSTFDLKGDLVKRYSAVDISLQADDGDPAHSPESVLRASYAA